MKSLSNKPMPRGGRQRQRTRSALLNAGEQLFASRPVESVTVDQIVDAAEVAKGSFYNHFEDKEAFADAVYELIQGDIEYHVYVANQDIADPSQRAARALCTVVRYARHHPERLLATLSLARRASETEPLNAGLAADIRHGLEHGDMRGVNVSTGILVMIGLIRSAIMQAMLVETDAVQPLAANVAAAMLRALGVDFDRSAEIGAAAARAILGGEA